jgi:hypothetical protein
LKGNSTVTKQSTQMMYSKLTLQTTPGIEHRVFKIHWHEWQQLASLLGL